MRSSPQSLRLLMYASAARLRQTARGVTMTTSTPPDDLAVGVPTIADADSTDTDSSGEATPDEELVDEELLVEEVSIDGMCGVY